MKEETYPKVHAKSSKITPVRDDNGNLEGYRMTFTTEFLLSVKQLEEMTKEAMRGAPDILNSMDIKQCLKEGAEKIEAATKAGGYPLPGSTYIPDFGVLGIKKPQIRRPVYDSVRGKYFALSDEEIAREISKGNICYTFSKNGQTAYYFVQNGLKLDKDFEVVDNSRDLGLLKKESPSPKPNIFESYFDRTVDQHAGSTLDDVHKFRPTSKVGVFLQFSGDGCGLEGHIVFSRFGQLPKDNHFEMMEPGNLCGAMNKIIRQVHKDAQSVMGVEQLFCDQIESVLFLTEQHADQIAKSEEFRLFCLEFKSTTLTEIEKVGYPHFQERANLRYDADNGRPLKIRTGTPVFQAVAKVVPQKETYRDCASQV